MSEERFCDVCNSEIKITLTPNNIHYGRLDCIKCGFRCWIKNPNNPRNKGTKLIRQPNKLTVEKINQWHGFNEEFCYLCLRKKNELGVRETLTADHILELRETKEGENRDNVRNGQVLCTACHKIKLWLTTYLNEHIKAKKRR